jgi:hypothetical protein
MPFVETGTDLVSYNSLTAEIGTDPISQLSHLLVKFAIRKIRGKHCLGKRTYRF